MARLRRQWAVQVCRAWTGSTGEALTWSEPVWTTDKDRADAILDMRQQQHAAHAEGSWERHRTQCRMITRVASDPEVVTDGQASA